MKASQETAEVFFTAFKALGRTEKEAFIEKMISDNRLRKDLLDIALIEEAKKVRKLIETLDMLEFSTASSETFGKLSNELKRNGKNIGDFDLLIASIALSHGETLLTRNIKHFSQVPGLVVETY